MLKELKISNFRVFDDEVTIRFRPITVLIGRNNSGKSSIIKFLLMLQQSLNPDNAQFLNPEGEKVKFGNFHALKNTLTKKSDLVFQLTATEYRTGGDILWRYLNKNKKPEDIKRDGGELSFITNATISYEREGQPLKKHEAILSHDGKKSLTKNRYLWDGENKSLLDFSKEFEVESEKEKQGENIELHSVEKNFISAFRKNINDLYYLLPIRQSISERVIVTEHLPSMSVGQRGKYALPHLKNIIMGEDEFQRKFIFSHIEAIADIKEIKFKQLSHSIAECWAVNKITGAEVLIHNFGFGVSQCMPIFVQGAIMPGHTSLMVEEPESHLHPTAQLELGSFFADLWKERKVGSIIETHSGNILLRLRRLVAKGYLTPGNVSVAFFDFKNGKSIVRNLDIHRDGSMEEGLPMEFFAAHIIEGLHMGAGG